MNRVTDRHSSLAFSLSFSLSLSVDLSLSLSLSLTLSLSHSLFLSLSLSFSAFPSPSLPLSLTHTHKKRVITEKRNGTLYGLRVRSHMSSSMGSQVSFLCVDQVSYMLFLQNVSLLL